MHPIWDNLKVSVVDVDFVTIDIDQDPATATAHQIQAIPTFVFVKDGVEQKRITGAVREKELLDIINGLR
jgi:thioredoxin 1